MRVKALGIVYHREKPSRDSFYYTGRMNGRLSGSATLTDGAAQKTNREFRYGRQVNVGIQKPWVALPARLMVLMHESTPASS
jgi:hypothetical protein